MSVDKWNGVGECTSRHSDVQVNMRSERERERERE